VVWFSRSANLADYAISCCAKESCMFAVILERLKYGVIITSSAAMFTRFLNSHSVPFLRYRIFAAIFLCKSKHYSGSEWEIYNKTLVFFLTTVWTELTVCFPQRQTARVSKNTKDGLTRSGTGCFIAVPIWQQWASKD